MVKGIVWKSPRYNAVSFAEEKAFKSAFNKNKGKVCCRVCKGFLCICQLNLFEWVEVRVRLEDVNPVDRCQRDCVNYGEVLCINCYDYDKFKMMVRL